MQVPAQRYERSDKRYRAQPPSWDYQESVQVKRIGTSGSLRWQGKGYFVSNALNGRWVGVEPVEDKLLVRYRQMYLCEIDLKTDRVTSFLKPATTGGGRLQHNQGKELLKVYRMSWLNL